MEISSFNYNHNTITTTVWRCSVYWYT